MRADAVVIDASVLLAAFMADGTTRHAFFAATDIAFHAPALVVEEVEAALPKVARRTGQDPRVIQALWTDFRARILLVPNALLEPFWEAARSRVQAADAWGDGAYVAPALALKAPIWTLDHDFRRIEGIEVITAADLLP